MPNLPSPSTKLYIQLGSLHNPLIDVEYEAVLNQCNERLAKLNFMLTDATPTELKFKGPMCQSPAAESALREVCDEWDIVPSIQTKTEEAEREEAEQNRIIFNIDRERIADAP